MVLMLLHDSRRHARVQQGVLVTLEEQDRSLWDRGQIDEGLTLLEPALRMSRPGPYQLQAAIAALHAEAVTAQDTDWSQIAALYCELERVHPTPVISLNCAVAIGMSKGPAAGLAVIQRLGESGALDNYHLFHAAQAELLRRLGDREAATTAYQRALSLTENDAEREYLQRRIQTH
jgi:RNA polymerase sigma-70 factor (ECF subfamily)